jgi:hypothetical protein
MTTARFLITAALAIFAASVACASRSNEHYSFPTKGGAERGYDAPTPSEHDASADTGPSRQR